MVWEEGCLVRIIQMPSIRNILQIPQLISNKDIASDRLLKDTEAEIKTGNDGFVSSHSYHLVAHPILSYMRLPLDELTL